jgi:hypothetical protein
MTKLCGIRRKFNQKMFDKYDIPARNIIKEKLGDFVQDNEDIYQQDLIITDPDFKYKYIEIQVCINWVEDKYPYDTVSIYERKGHYGDDTLFITLNRLMTKCLIFSAASIKDVKPRRLKKYSREFVYDVPWYRILPIFTDHLSPDDIRIY